MKKFSSNIDNLKYLDEQEALMKAFRTDAKMAEEKAEMTGLKKGEKKKAIEKAKNAIAIGLKNEDISKITGLSVKEIENLR